MDIPQSSLAIRPSPSHSLANSTDDSNLQDIVCAKCGVVGGPLYKELLVYCNTCRAAAQHRYCMDPNTMVGALRPWSCEDCSPIPLPLKSGTARIKSCRGRHARLAKCNATATPELLHGVTSHSEDGEPNICDEPVSVAKCNATPELLQGVTSQSKDGEPNICDEPVSVAKSNATATLELLHGVTSQSKDGEPNICDKTVSVAKCNATATPKLLHGATSQSKDGEPNLCDKPERVAKCNATATPKLLHGATSQSKDGEPNLCDKPERVAKCNATATPKLLHGVTSQSKDGEPNLCDKPVRVAKCNAPARREREKFKKATRKSSGKDSNLKLPRRISSHAGGGEPSLYRDANGGTPASEKMDVSGPDCTREILQNRVVLRRETSYQLHRIEGQQLKIRMRRNQNDDSFHIISPEEESAALFSSPNVAAGPLSENNAMDEDCVQDTQACVKTAGKKRLMIENEHESDGDPGKRIDKNASTDTICQASKSIIVLVESDEDAAIPLRNQTSAPGVDAEILEPTPMEAPTNSLTKYRPGTNGASYVPVLPIIDPIWSGCFHIYTEQYGPFGGHLSTRACDRVWKVSGTLPQALHVVMRSRSDLWPKSFQISPPTEDNIALLFFPSDSRNENLPDQFVEDVIVHDYALKASLDDAELLVFASNVLPANYQRFCGKYYLWGVFKAKCVDANEATVEKNKKIVPEKAEDLADADGLTKREKRGKGNLSKAHEKLDEACQDTFSGGACAEPFNRSSGGRETGLSLVDGRVRK